MKPSIVSLEIFIIRDDEYFVVYCPALELSTQGEDEATAKLAFKDAVEIFFEETLKKGTLHSVLKGLGWDFIMERPQPPAPVDTPLYMQSRKVIPVEVPAF